MSAAPRQLDLFLHGQKIGTITHLGGDRTILAFEDTYVNDPERSTLSLSFRNTLGEVIRTQPATQTQLHPYFSNLLPEGPLLIYLARLTKVKPVREYSLLAALGEDLPGAIIVRPFDQAGLSRLTTSSAQETELLQRRPLHFSLAGVQLKFSAVEKAQGGLTIPANGEGGSWIMKLPSLRFVGLAANEFSMMTLARHIGIDVPEIRLINLAQVEGLPSDIEQIKEDAFAIRRFDRSDGDKRIHTEDFAQVFGVYPSAKYERASYRSIAEVLWKETGPAGVTEFIRRLVFNTLIGNADMHLKNWALIYPNGRAAQIAPAYDLLSTIAYLPDDEAALKFARTRKMTGLTLDELTYLAKKAFIPKDMVIDTARETVTLFHQAWQAKKTALPISDLVRTTIDQHISGLPIATIG